MRFFLGTHCVSPKWWDSEVPLFVSRRILTLVKRLPAPRVPWALDSGGFTELDKYGGWNTTVNDYVNDVLRFQEMGHLSWVAPQDWMCEPHMLAKTGLTVPEHQARTVANFLVLRQRLGQLVIPVVQGWERDDYLRCWDMYDQAGVDLESEQTVGLGTVCRRQGTVEAEAIVRALAPLRLHGFGVKTAGLVRYGDGLISSDSMAWSFTARRSPPLPGCVGHKNCANCIRFAMRWRARLVEKLEHLEVSV